jgi:subtilisin family serine protease
MEQLKISPQSLAGSQSKSLTSAPVQGVPAQYATKRTAMLFGCYRKGDANDPEIYTAAIAATLAEYEQEVVDYVTDPRTGLPSKLKWLPTVAEVREACEDRKSFCAGRDAMIAKGWRLDGHRWIKPGEE